MSMSVWSVSSTASAPASTYGSNFPVFSRPCVFCSRWIVHVFAQALDLLGGLVEIAAELVFDVAGLRERGRHGRRHRRRPQTSATTVPSLA